MLFHNFLKFFIFLLLLIMLNACGNKENNTDNPDSDNDGVLDINDAFPLDATETEDLDGDGVGNNADTDDDGDGVLDVNDAYPLISLGGLTDSDGDGIPNDCDAACVSSGMVADNDDDNDGVSDNLDLDDNDNGLIEIYTLDDLDSIRHHQDGTGLHGNSLGCNSCQGFELQNDLDFDENQDGVVDGNDYGGIYWNGGLGWMPIGYDWAGTFITTFTSLFEGNNYTIRNLTIDAQSDLGLGLFYYVEYSAIQNLNLHGTLTKTSATTIRGAGLLASFVNYTSLISNVHVTGSLDTTRASKLGGMIGTVYGTSAIITGCSSKATVNGGSTTGGLIGSTSGSSEQFPLLVEHSYATGNITGQFVLGGLIGEASYTTVTNSFTTGDITNSSSATRADTGGLIGRFTLGGRVEISYTTGDVSSPGYDVGGLVGYAEEVSGASISLSDVHTLGNVTGERYVGGLVGYSDSVFFSGDAYVTGVITGTTNVAPFTSGPGYGYGVENQQYWNIETTALYSSFGSGLTTYQLQCTIDNVTVCAGESTNPFTDWNAATWYFGTSNQYPSLKIDTDGDGLYNGQEDLNLNGQVDVGETDFLSSDTDNDTFNDSVDAFPLDDSQH